MPLILARRPDERIIVRHRGEELVITVVETHSWLTRLGFDGPRSFTVFREEVQDRIDSGERRD